MIKIEMTVKLARCIQFGRWKWPMKAWQDQSVIKVSDIAEARRINWSGIASDYTGVSAVDIAVVDLTVGDRKAGDC